MFDICTLVFVICLFRGVADSMSFQERSDWINELVTIKSGVVLTITLIQTIMEGCPTQ